jgi:RNA polymerase sigma-70 factor (ECF subfamily)
MQAATLELRATFAPTVRRRLQPMSENLLRRCQAGDTEAFRLLFRDHRDDVARLVHRMLGPSADLEDVVQEVFVQVHKSLDSFRHDSRFSTWLYRVTVNVVLMHRRAARSRPVLTELAEVRAPKDPRPLPDEEVARRLRIAAFYRLLDRLSDKKRAVYVLHDLEGVPAAQVAKIVGAPVLTVRTRLFYARRDLAALLRDEPVLAALADELAPESVRGAPAGARKEPVG